MSREVIESVKIVIKEDGQRMRVEATGCATSGIVMAFMCFSPARREFTIKKLIEEHERMLKREQEKSVVAVVEGGAP